MVDLTDSQKQSFYQYAKSVEPNEACAILIREGIQTQLVFCKNISHEPRNQFLICPNDYADAEDKGEVLAVIHSHPYVAARPSQADLIGCERSGVPWFILGGASGEWCHISPKQYEVPLLGRSFCYGVFDCWEMVRDYYLRILNVELPYIQTEYEWWLRGQNHFIDFRDEFGFFEVDQKEIQKHDLILFQLRSPVPNHVGVYLGDEMFLHQMHKRLSARDILGGFWFKNMIKVFRYKGALIETGAALR